MLDLLACPDCKEPLTEEESSAVWVGSSLEEGVLVCASCSARYPVRRGIPRFASHDRAGSDVPIDTGEHFRTEFTAFPPGALDADPPELVEYHFLTRTGIDMKVYDAMPGDLFRTEMAEDERFDADDSLIAGKAVLDAGCGLGRFTRAAAGRAELVIGLDIGDHVDAASAACADLPNVEFVQGSVLALPFLSGSFDYGFSIGVLHHTPDPKRGVKEIAGCIRPGGHLSVWVYPKSYWNGLIRGMTGRAVHAVLTRMPPRTAWWICARVLYPLGRLQMRVARRRWTKVLFAPLFLVSVPRHPRREVMITTIFDYYGPKIISTHTYEEVESWFRDADLGDLRRLPLPTAWIGRKR